MLLRSLPMNQRASLSPVPQWWLHSDGHVLAGAIVVRDNLNIEAQILLDGTLLYGSRHPTRAVAEQELAALRGQCAREGWIDTV
jgi:hypothetical protein